ncbi:hypothetical protein GE09DRAFT_1273431 [Coniochaeta sp. 2T2.1]|nr:hypothetical protein GE09DRAFT_1273431 [Coniochaeta sp. 2T2.1]
MKFSIASLSLLALLGSGLAAPATEPLDADIDARATKSALTYSWVSDNCPMTEQVYSNYVGQGECAPLPGSSTVPARVPSGCTLYFYKNSGCSGTRYTVTDNDIARARCITTMAYNSLKRHLLKQSRLPLGSAKFATTELFVGESFRISERSRN